MKHDLSISGIHTALGRSLPIIDHVINCCKWPIHWISACGLQFLQEMYVVMMLYICMLLCINFHFVIKMEILSLIIGFYSKQTGKKRKDFRIMELRATCKTSQVSSVSHNNSDQKGFKLSYAPSPSIILLFATKLKHHQATLNIINFKVTLLNAKIGTMISQNRPRGHLI